MRFTSAFMRRRIAATSLFPACTVAWAIGIAGIADVASWDQERPAEIVHISKAVKEAICFKGFSFVLRYFLKVVAGWFAKLDAKMDLSMSLESPFLQNNSL